MNLFYKIIIVCMVFTILGVVTLLVITYIPVCQPFGNFIYINRTEVWLITENNKVKVESAKLGNATLRFRDKNNGYAVVYLKEGNYLFQGVVDGKNVKHNIYVSGSEMYVTIYENEPHFRPHE